MSKNPWDGHRWDEICSKMDTDSLRQSFLRHLKYTQGESRVTATPLDLHAALASAVRDRLIERMIQTQSAYFEKDVKRVYYLSMEYLMGRYLTNNLINLKFKDMTLEALKELELDWSKIEDFENDAGLGGGGLGRLAACFLDSLATLEYPAYGYGLRYEYGTFRQELVNGYQVERPDEWLRWGNPWELPRPESYQVVEFEGRVEHWADERGRYRSRLTGTRAVIAQPYDTLILGYGNNTVNLLRLWSARSSAEFDFGIFNAGDYVNAVLDKTLTETISRVLYPSDFTTQGRELRFRQQYFFVSATVKDIIRRYKKNHEDFASFPKKTAIQMNDTHPSLAVSELMRVLLDIEEIPWDAAWEITRNSLGYTNHTLLPEALERWPVELMERIVPRNLEIVYEINRRFLGEVRELFPDDEGKVNRMSLIEEGPVKHVRMANLAIVGSHKVNGVAQLHSDLVKSRLVPDFAEMWPDRFMNVTNGVTQRRWMLLSNPGLSELITRQIGDSWISRLDSLRKLLPLAKDKKFSEQFCQVKQANKERLTKLIEQEVGVQVDPKSIFDVQVKRIHEYKRQHLNALHILTLYNRLKRDPKADIHPRTFIFAGKAAPGYMMAKSIIKLITSIADLVNQDPDTNDRLKVVFLPNYCVSQGQVLFPAADVSEQISTAGKEASGTGNMKFSMNGALTLGTLDGANIEILEEVGDQNIFIFGLKAEEVESLKPRYNPRSYYESDSILREALDQIMSGELTPDEPDVLKSLAYNLIESDPFMVLADFDAYAAAQERIDKAFRDQRLWTTMAIRNVACMGKFSSDRSIEEYARNIWGLEPVPISLR